MWLKKHHPEVVKSHVPAAVAGLPATYPSVITYEDAAWGIRPDRSECHYAPTDNAKAFYLRLKDDSMAAPIGPLKTYPPGMLVCFAPIDHKPPTGTRVLAIVDD